MPIGRKLGRTFGLACEGRQLSGQSEQMPVDHLRMQPPNLHQMQHERLGTIHQLQQQEIGPIRDPAAPHSAHASGARLGLTVQQTAQLLDEIGKTSADPVIDTGRDEGAIQHHLAVRTTLEDPRHTATGEPVARLALEHQAQIEPPDLHRCLGVRTQSVVAHAELADPIAQAGLGLLRAAALGSTRAAQRQGEIKGLTRH